MPTGTGLITACRKGAQNESALALAPGLHFFILRTEAMGKEMAAEPNDPREARTAEDAAAETEEPAEATRVRAEDDAETRVRQAAAAAGLRDADRTLEDGGALLRQTRAELRERERELERTGDLTRQVAENAADPRAQMAQIVEETRRSHKRGDSGAPADEPEPESSR